MSDRTFDDLCEAWWAIAEELGINDPDDLEWPRDTLDECFSRLLGHFGFSIQMWNDEVARRKNSY